MSLEKYRQKRQFKKTPEPKGNGRAAKPGWRFVVQKHAARRLHYDFRLELDGVLKSWAVPRGPSLNPSERRLAVHVEDHPIEYGDFEGTIPEGEYGAGTVIVWDRGTWVPDGDAATAYKKGRLTFQLQGEKLKGGWHLVRTADSENWLLMKRRDTEARPDRDILEERPESVLSGRTLKQAASQPKRTAKASAPARMTRPKGAKKAVMPASVEPQLATLVDAAPEEEQWLHEIKFDGYRLLCFLDEGKVVLRTRNQLDWTRRFPEIAEAVRELPARQALIDGEVVALQSSGASSFQGLQTALSESDTGHLVYYAFDLLYLDGYDLRKAPLEERKGALAELLRGTDQSRIQYSDHLVGRGPEFFRQSCQMGLEGIISKRRDRPYRSGRSGDWLKVKCVHREEFVIGGFAASTSAQRGLGALLVGYFNAAGELIYAGKVGTGFSEATTRELRARLSRIEQESAPFLAVPKGIGGRGTRWVRPELVAQIEYSEWTRDGHLRHASFQGLREDKAASTVVRDRQPQGKQERGTSVAHHSSPAQGLEGVQLTHPDRVLYPEQGLTKFGLASYYAAIADWILPHVVGRPLSLVRCPEGHGGNCFYQKHAGVGTPETLRRVLIQEKEKSGAYLAVDDLAGLVSLVQMGVLEIHPWGSRTEDVDRPDRVVFDLDPDPSVTWPAVVGAAQELRDRLSDVGLTSFLKTTGGKGLHLVLPLQRRQTWDEVKAFSRAVAEQMAADSPERYTANLSKAARRGRIFIDYLRNDRGATAVAAYSTRARPGAPVSTPLAWSELSPALRSDHFRVGYLPGRLSALKADPWEEMESVRQSLTSRVRRKLGL